MKFLLMCCGQLAANSRFACLYCKCNLLERQDWAKVVTCREADDQIDPTKGQMKKNLFPYIPRDRVIIDLLHLLLRCMDRFVHVTAVLCLHLLAPLLATDEDQTSFLNKTLAPVMGQTMGKTKRCSLVKGSTSSKLWQLTRVNETGYRNLLEKFKYTDVVGDLQKTLVAKY